MTVFRTCYRGANNNNVLTNILLKRVYMREKVLATIIAVILILPVCANASGVAITIAGD